MIFSFMKHFYLLHKHLTVMLILHRNCSYFSKISIYIKLPFVLHLLLFCFFLLSISFYSLLQLRLFSQQTQQNSKDLGLNFFNYIQKQQSSNSSHVSKTILLFSPEYLYYTFYKYNILCISWFLFKILNKKEKYFKSIKSNNPLDFFHENAHVFLGWGSLT